MFDVPSREQDVRAMSELAGLQGEPSAPAPSAERRTIFLYAGTISVALNFVSPAVGAFIIPLSFLLKNKLHFTANGLAAFAMWASVPGYLCFLFGMVRDFWNPFGLGDRGYFLLFGAVSAVLFAGFSFIPVSGASLFAAAFLTTVAYLFLWAAWNGLASTIAKAHGMSGQMSATWNFAGTLASIAALALGGVLSDRLEGESGASAVRSLFLIAAIVMTSIAALGFWKPHAVFALSESTRDEGRNMLGDLLRLVRHRPIYPALTIWLLWNFSPASQTPLQYYLSDALHASDAQWGAYNAILFAAAIPSYVLFGYLSRKVSLASLLWLGTIIGIPQVVPLVLVHSPDGVLISALATGFMGGLATAAFFDLLIRSCPPQLEGSLMMLAWSMYALATGLGNVWGAELYQRGGGFVVCVIATTIVYALILPLIPLIPRNLIVDADEVRA